jgi:uncharacterized membrane protein
MTNFFIALSVAAIVMGLIDWVWLGFVAKKLYYKEIGKLLLEKPYMPAAIAFYILYVIGIVVFAVNPAIEKASWQYALGYGALFGLLAYATYDLTNWATLKGWSRKIVIIDMTWGAVLTGTVALVTYIVCTGIFVS